MQFFNDVPNVSKILVSTINFKTRYNTQTNHVYIFNVTLPMLVYFVLLVVYVSDRHDPLRG